MPSPELREFIETGIRVLQILRDEITPRDAATPQPSKPNGNAELAIPESIPDSLAEKVDALFDQPQPEESPEPESTPEPTPTASADPVPPLKKKIGRPFGKRTLGAEAQKAINETVKTAASKDKDPEAIRDDIVKKCGKHYVGGDKAKKDLIDKFKKTHKLEYMRDMEDELLPLAKQMLFQLEAMDGV